MVVRSLQERIDALPWYHEFDFGDGLHARSRSPHAPGHRLVWKFIERQLDRVDFRDKSVLDIGCWDGYWSFQAERRGAKSVLATDDCSQNWADGQGVHLAKELLRSSVKVRQDVSVYQLASLNEKFDVILFLCVFYHLHDLFYAFTQIRHCCRRDTVVVVEGSAATELGQGELLCNFSNHACEVLPSLGALRQILRRLFQRRQPRFHEPAAAGAGAHAVGVEAPAAPVLARDERLLLRNPRRDRANRTAGPGARAAPGKAGGDKLPAVYDFDSL